MHSLCSVLERASLSVSRHIYQSNLSLETTEVRELTFRGSRAAWSIISAIRIHDLSAATQLGERHFESAEWVCMCAFIFLHICVHLCGSVNLRVVNDDENVASNNLKGVRRHKLA